MHKLAYSPNLVKSVRNLAGKPVSETGHLSNEPLRIYLSCAIEDFSTFRCDTVLDLIYFLLPNATVLEPKKLFATTADWLRQWPDIYPTLDCLWFFPMFDGSVSMGVTKEVIECHNHGVPVFCFFHGWVFPVDIPCPPLSEFEFLRASVSLDTKFNPPYPRIDIVSLREVSAFLRKAAR